MSISCPPSSRSHHPGKDIPHSGHIQRDHHEERDPKRGLDALVAQHPLREPRARPAAQELHHVQRRFGRAPRALPRRALVQRIRDKRHQAHDRIQRGNQRPRMRPIPCNNITHIFLFSVGCPNDITSPLPHTSTEAQTALSFAPPRLFLMFYKKLKTK